MYRYPCPGVEAAREGGRCNVGVKGRRTCESDVKGRRSGESDPKGLRTGKSGTDARCVVVLADCECVGSVIISIHVGERGGASAPDVTSMRIREGERCGFCEGAAIASREGVRVVAGLSRGTKSFVTEKENFCRDDNRNFAPRDDMRP